MNSHQYKSSPDATYFPYLKLEQIFTVF